MRRRSKLSRLSPLDSTWTVDALIGYFIGLTKHPNADDPVVTTVLHATSPGPDGALQDVSFQLHMTLVGEVRRLEITRR